MATEVKKSNTNFGNVFVKEEVAPKKATLLTDLLDDYVYHTYNRSKEDMEAAYGDKLIPSFHPSRLAKAFCERKLVLEFLEAPFEEELSFTDAIGHRIFHNGHGVHERIQGYMAGLGKFTKGKCVLIGRWKCKCGEKYGFRPEKSKKKENDFWVPRPDKCKACGRDGRHMEYKEAGIEIPDLRIKGKMDGVLEWKDEQWIVEIKSMNPFQYAKLMAPPDYYIPQSEIYQHASGIHKMIWIFEDKATQQQREFITQHNYKNIEKIMSLVARANAHINAKTLPEKYKDNRSCKACEYRKLCEGELEYGALIRMIDKTLKEKYNATEV